MKQISVGFSLGQGCGDLLEFPCPPSGGELTGPSSSTRRVFVVVPIRRETRLLIADDDPRFREAVVEIVMPYFHTIAVESGEQAIEVVETQLIDVAIFDMNMYEISGLDAIRWLRQHELALPCILMSGEITEEIEREALELQTYSLIRKPPRRKHLMDTICCALEL